jgi:hypothetical protein
VGPLPGEDGWEREETIENEGGLLQRSFIFHFMFPLTRSIFSYRRRFLFPVERNCGEILILSFWSYVMQPACQSELGKHNKLACCGRSCSGNLRAMVIPGSGDVGDSGLVVRRERPSVEEMYQLFIVSSLFH